MLLLKTVGRKGTTISVNFKKKKIKEKLIQNCLRRQRRKQKKCRQPKLCSIKTVQADFRIRLP